MLIFYRIIGYCNALLKYTLSIGIEQPKRKILFLDFDGVLHNRREANFSKLPLLTSYLVQMPKLEIVVSSAWREASSLEILRQHFPPELQNIIIGVTPRLAEGYDQGGRQKEIEQFLRNEQLDCTNASWIALDDMSSLFAEDCNFLIKVDSRYGFRNIDGYKLLQWYLFII